MIQQIKLMGLKTTRWSGQRSGRGPKKTSETHTTSPKIWTVLGELHNYK